MNERDLQRVLRLAGSRTEAEPARAGFADGVLARLPVVRFVIPGSSPGGRVLVVAGVLALATAMAISLSARPATAAGQGTSGAAVVFPTRGSAAGSGTSPVSEKSPQPGRPGFQLFQPQEPQYRPAMISTKP